MLVEAPGMSFLAPAYQCKEHPNSSFSNQTQVNVFRREGEELFRSQSYFAVVLALKKKENIILRVCLFSFTYELIGICSGVESSPCGAPSNNNCQCKQPFNMQLEIWLFSPGCW